MLCIVFTSLIRRRQQTKQRVEADLVISMVPNFLYGLKSTTVNDHHYETVTAVHTAINTEPNIVYSVQNPLFPRSGLVLKQPAVDEDILSHTLYMLKPVMLQLQFLA